MRKGTTKATTIQSPRTQKGAHNVTIAVHVKPGSKAESVGARHGVVEIRVKEPAREGKANAACRKALARALGVPASTLELVRGEHARVKVFRCSTLDPAELAARLARLGP
jgi:uncharacterized protein (TIGR00251 family)